MKRRSVAIVGAGASGVALAAQIARRRNAPAVTLIERNCFGPGLAYATTDPAHLLNVRASRMSLLADAPDHFGDWLRRRSVEAADDPFAPRAMYRAYLESVLKRAERSRVFGGFRRERGEAVSITPAAGRWLVGLDSGRELLADAAVLAIGHTQPRAPGVVARSGVATIGAWDHSALRRISPKADVLILGTGLSMVDVVLTLTSRKRSGVIYALSRRGLTPRPQLAGGYRAGLSPLELPDQPSLALRAFREEIARMAARGEPWQAAFDRIRELTPAFWRRLSPAAQQRFLRHLRPWWDVHRHRAAPEVAGRIAALMAHGRLRVFAGELLSISPTQIGVQVVYRQRGGLARHRLEAAHLVNCTGADNRVDAMDEPLVKQLLADGLARPHPSGLGFDVTDEGELIGASGEPVAGLLALGPIVQGAFWETTAVPEIRQRAASLADLLCVR